MPVAHTIASQLTVFAAGPRGVQVVEGLLRWGVSVTRVASYPQKGDLSGSFKRLEAFARQARIPFESNRHPQLTTGEWVMVVGWQYMFPDAGDTVVVFHDSLLPKYRGFAPTVTALINGDSEIGITALRPATEVDAGPILGQRAAMVDYPIKIDQALKLQGKLTVDLAVELVQRAAAGTLSPVEQDESRASISLWRDEVDYWIDWSEPADRICRTVDALGAPYAGARTLHDGKLVTLVDVSAVTLPPVEIRQPGKFWAIEDGRPIVICGAGAVRVNRAVIDGSEVLFEQLRTRFSSPLKPTFSGRHA